MKKLFLGFLFLFLLSFNCIKASSPVCNFAPEIKVQVNQDIVTGDGCKWHVEGWVDIGVNMSMDIVVNSCDLTASGPCGDYHIVTGINHQDTDSSDHFDPEKVDLEKILTGLVENGKKVKD